MENNEIKSKIQEECAEALLKTENLRGTFELATGVGKTFAAFTTIFNYMQLDKELFSIKSTKVYNILILAEVQNREVTIMDDLKKFEQIRANRTISMFSNITFMCYQSAYKLKDTHWDIVIADEIHDSLTEQYSKFYFNNKYDMLIGLSATISRGTIVKEDEENKLTKGMLLDELCPVVYTLNQVKAIDLGLIAPYNVLVLEQSLDSVEAYVKAGTKAKPFLSTEQSSYNYYDNQFKQALFLSDTNPRKEFMILNYSRKRAQVLWGKKSKIRATREILERVNKKTVVFGNDLGSLSQITPYLVSSKNNKVKNDRIINDFNNNKIREIGSFKMLKQGANLTGASLCILHSYYSVKKDYIQRLGRVLRVEPGKVANIVILVTTGTQEESWYNKMTIDKSLEVVRTTDVNDIINYLNSQ